MRFSNLALRLTAAALFIPVYLYAVYTVESLLILINVGIVLIATYEFMRLGSNRRDPEILPTMIVAGYCHFLMSQNKPGTAASLAVIPFVLVLLIRIIQGRPQGTMLRASRSSAAVLYISWLFGHMYLLLSMHGRLQTWEIDGWRLAMVPVVLTWFVDTAAYGIGRLWGRTPFAPAVSPNKTWEGAIGGFVAGIVGGIIASLLGFVPAVPGIAIGVFVGSFGQLGDLSESLLKREVRVKDSSTIIPGHGGVLDRFDSLLINVPGSYYLLALLAPVWR